jgi:hypothetical protein
MQLGYQKSGKTVKDWLRLDFYPNGINTFQKEWKLKEEKIILKGSPHNLR